MDWGLSPRIARVEETAQDHGEQLVALDQRVGVLERTQSHIEQALERINGRLDWRSAVKDLMLLLSALAALAGWMRPH